MLLIPAREIYENGYFVSPRYFGNASSAVQFFVLSIIYQ